MKQKIRENEKQNTDIAQKKLSNLYSKFTQWSYINANMIDCVKDVCKFQIPNNIFQTTAILY